MRRDEERVEIRDEAPEWHWWTRLPNIVLEKIENPFEGWLLLVIRKVAGDDLKNGCPVGVCSMSQRKLAEVANMSRTQVSRTMHALLQKGLIEGELKKAEDGEGWPVWHITIPRSLWERQKCPPHGQFPPKVSLWCAQLRTSLLRTYPPYLKIRGASPLLISHMKRPDTLRDYQMAL